MLKAGLVEFVDDDRATLLGAFLDLADQLRDGRQPSPEPVSPADLRTRHRRRGLRAFDADREATTAVVIGAKKEDELPGENAAR